MPFTIAEELQKAVEFIKKQYPHVPRVGIVLGSGLGHLVDEVLIEKEMDYRDIPHFPVSTVKGHPGKMIFGELKGKKIIVMAGRFHYYEGYTAQQVVFPIRVMKLLGIETLLISNAAGAMNPMFRVGDLMIIKDHISLFTVNPLLGINIDALGPRFPDMSEPYKKSLISKVKQIGLRLNIPLKEGVYAGVTGPTFETRSEYKFLQLGGADAVGMSTVQEVIAAVHMGLSVFALSVITDLGIVEGDNRITHEEVLEAAVKAEPKLTILFKELIAEL